MKRTRISFWKSSDYIKFLAKRKKAEECNHEGKMYPVQDWNGWVVGMLCDCGYFIHRKNIPCYEERLKQSIELKDRVKKLRGKLK
jgi:hypothetical protein